MMKFGSVGVFSLLWNQKPNCQTIPGVDLWHHYNFAEAQRSLWEKSQLQFWWLHPRGFRPGIRRYTKVAAQQLKEVLTAFQPDLVIAECFAERYVPLVKDYGCRLILDEHNVVATWLEEHYSTYYSIENRKLTINKKIELSLEFSRAKLIERNLVRQANQVWMCSDDDDKLLQELYGKVSHTRVVPNGIDVAHYECVRLGECTLPEGLEDKQRNLLYLGLFSYSPNTVAAELLIDQIYPRLRQVYPDCRLLLVGRNPTQRMKEAAKRDSGIIVTGEVADVRPYLAAASVMAVPLRHGGGTRLKILEAFAAGCPVVSTTKGFEGLKAKDGEHLLIRDEIEAIVEGVCQLWSDPSLGQKLANSAYELVRAEYSWEAVGRRVESAVRELL
jgi:glycosyltransferase involved in cell wall biosynthesis